MIIPPGTKIEFSIKWPFKVTVTCFGINGKPSDSVMSYCNAGVISKVSKHTASENTENCCCRQFHSRLTPLQWRRKALRGPGSIVHQGPSVARPEWQKLEGLRVRAGAGFWGGGSKPCPHQLRGLGESCKLPQWGLGRSPTASAAKF